MQPRSTAPLTRLGLCLLCLATGCGGSQPRERLAPVASSPTHSGGIELREIERLPPFVLVERSGDPKPALSVAVAHDLGSVASVALSALFERRLRDQGFRTTTGRPHGLGFQLVALVGSEGEAKRFVAKAREALSQPVRAREPALAEVASRLDALKSHTLATTGARALAGCSGELGIHLGQALPDSRSDKGVKLLETWRQTVFSQATVALAAVGPRRLLDDALVELEELGPWPEGAVPDDAWPEADETYSDPKQNGDPGLSVALRVAGPARALGAARTLGTVDSDLAVELAALTPSWSVKRTLATARVRGACVRVDLESEQNVQPDANQTARAVHVVEREIKRSLALSREDAFLLDQSVLLATDPREAAELAAWRAHVGRREPGEPRRFVQSVASSTRAANIDRELETLRRMAQRKSDSVVRAEPGQGQLWVLAATTCGTRAEVSDDAGLTALAMQAAAHRGSERRGVQLEAWASPQSVGLLAHAPRRPGESPETHAGRVARTLGEALASPIAGPELTVARRETFTMIGEQPRPAWWATVEALSPNHPSWLQPRGTWESISNATIHQLEQARIALLSQPLRFAVLANYEESQGHAAAAALQRFITPYLGSESRCPKASVAIAKTGLIEARIVDPASEPSAYVAVATHGNRRAQRATVELMNKKGGWLDRALVTPGLVANAQAYLLGGDVQGALVISVAALDDKVDQAIGQVRALLTRLAEGAASQAELDYAVKVLAAEDTLGELDPRGRIVALFEGKHPAKPLTLSELRHWHRSFRASRHLVVLVKPLGDKS